MSPVHKLLRTTKCFFHILVGDSPLLPWGPWCHPSAGRRGWEVACTELGLRRGETRDLLLLEIMSGHLNKYNYFCLAEIKSNQIKEALCRSQNKIPEKWGRAEAWQNINGSENFCLIVSPSFKEQVSPTKRWCKKSQGGDWPGKWY